MLAYCMWAKEETDTSEMDQVIFSNKRQSKKPFCGRLPLSNLDYCTKDTKKPATVISCGRETWSSEEAVGFTVFFQFSLIMSYTFH